jgi:protein-S-isoprenylcysteine O-methyltransferase Ste14
MEAVGIVVQCLGLAMVCYCLLVLGRSFGVVAADRGLKVHGPYRIIRHPIYVSHAVTELGFIIANPSWLNIAVFAVVCACQCFRILAEERVLTESADYGAYRSQVHWRLIPGVY